MRFTILSAALGQRGQASVELVAALPVMAVVLLCAWQLVVAGHAVWSTAEAARVSAREYAVRGRAAGDSAARAYAHGVAVRVLPPAMRGTANVAFPRPAEVAVRAQVPLVFPFSEVMRRGPAFTSRTRFAF